MNQLIITPEEAKRITREFFLRQHPDKEEWFELAWELVNENIGKMSNTENSIAFRQALGIAGEANGMALQLVKEIVVFIESILIKFPQAREPLITTVKTVCQKYNMGKTWAEDAIKHIKDEIEVEKKFVVWTSGPSGIGNEFYEATEAEVKKDVLAKKEGFDIFVYHRSVYVKKGREHKPINIEERIYKLLVMFLRYKDRYLSALALFKKAWAHVDRDTSGLPEVKDVKMDYLKSPISELRAKIGIDNFKIITPRSGKGYTCLGNFKFCIVLDRFETDECKLLEGDMDYE